jgi:hypothetical protein
MECFRGSWSGEETAATKTYQQPCAGKANAMMRYDAHHGVDRARRAERALGDPSHECTAGKQRSADS